MFAGVGALLAASTVVWLVLSAPGGVHAATARRLQELWELDGRLQIDWRIGTWSELLQDAQALPQLVVTLGTGAYLEGVERAQKVVALQPLPVLAALLPQAAYPAPAARGSWRNSAVFLDQPAERIALLLRLALPEHERVGVLFGPESIAARPQLARALAARGLRLVDQTLPEGGHGLYPALRALLDDADLLLAMPDKLIFQPDNIHNILLASYRQRVPVVSYSAAHVRAGALLSLHTDPADVARQIAAALQRWLNGNGLPAPAAAARASVAVNEQVARSLGLSLPPALALERALRSREAAS
jgi:putative tryptophan/tyrosine transport system substrate-binding protein